MAEQIQKIFGNEEYFIPEIGKRDDVNISWSGDNLDKARQEAARELVDYIKEHHKKGEAITLVGHSHGGNVDIIAMNLIVNFAFFNIFRGFD